MSKASLLFASGLDLFIATLYCQPQVEAHTVTPKSLQGLVQSLSR